MTNRERAGLLREMHSVLSDGYPKLAHACSDTVDYIAGLLERTPDMRPYTIEELAQLHDVPVWAQAKHRGHWDILDHINQGEDRMWFSEGRVMPFLGDYGKTFRLWPDKPTPEQSTAWAWEEGNP